MNDHSKMIYVSLGTTFMFKENELQSLLDFSRMRKDYGIVLVLKNDKLYNQILIRELNSSSNILYRKWMPQTQVLSHPHTKLFLSHGGKNSLLEASEFGIPILIHP